MLAFNYAIRSVKLDKGEEFWVLPDGKVVDYDETSHQITVLNPGIDESEGWWGSTFMGDSWIGDDGHLRTNSYVHIGGTNGELRSIRIDRKASRPTEPRYLGGYQGWSSPFVTVDIAALNSTGFGTNLLAFDLNSSVKAGIVSNPTAEWEWVAGYPDPNQRSDFIAGIQDHYLADMTYDVEAIAARNVAMFTRRPLNVRDNGSIIGTFDGTIGRTIDKEGTVRPILDLTPGQMDALGQANGFIPYGQYIITRANREWSWKIIRPLVAVDDDTVRCLAILEHYEEYDRLPDPYELAYFFPPQRSLAQNANSLGIPNPNATYYFNPLDWNGTQRFFAKINERRRVYVSCLMDIRKSGIVDVTVTGRSMSRSSQVTTANTSVSANMMHRFDGGVDYFVGGSGNGYLGPDNDHYYDAQVGGSTYLTTPNGWEVPVAVPLMRNGDGVMVQDPSYPVLFRFPELVNNGANPPQPPSPKPKDWQVPEYDGGSVAQVGGNRFYRPSSGTFGYGIWGSSLQDFPANARLLNPNDSAGNQMYVVDVTDYPHTGAYRYYGGGTMVVAMHRTNAGLVYSTHAMTFITPGVEGPFGRVVQTIYSDGQVPFMRILQHPKHPSTIFVKPQGYPGWYESGGGNIGQQSYDFGPMNGTRSVMKTMVRPKPVEQEDGTIVYQ